VRWPLIRTGRRRGRSCAEFLDHAIGDSVRLDDELAVDHHRRGPGAETQAVDRFEPDAAIGRCAAQLSPGVVAEGLRQLARTSSLAGFCLAHRQGVLGRWLGAEIGVERDQAAHFCPAQVEDVGDRVHGVGVDPAVVRLDDPERGDRSTDVVRVGRDQSSQFWAGHGTRDRSEGR
jgi:hypothetical protein